MQLYTHNVGNTSFLQQKANKLTQANIHIVMMECKRHGVHKLFSLNRTKQAYSKFNFPSNMPIRLATTLRKDWLYNPDIYAVFLWNEKRKLLAYGEYKLAANNLFKKKKTNFFKRAKLASKTLKENCSKREKYCMLSNLNNVNFFLPYQFWTLFSFTTCSNIIVLDNFCLVYILV